MFGFRSQRSTKLAHDMSSRRQPAPCRPRLEVLESRDTPAAFSFNNGAPDGLMGTASRPASRGAVEIESADDFPLTSETQITKASFIGLVPRNFTASDINRVRVEMYGVFPVSSDPNRVITVPTRNNSPSDVAIGTRDSAGGTLSFTAHVVKKNFTAQNSVINGIHPSPNQTTGGEGARSGQEVRIVITFSTPFDLPAGHYFIVPQIKLSHGNFFWLSSPHTAGSSFPNTNVPDLQEWIRNDPLAPDWLRVGTDIVGGATPPQFNASFTLAGQTVTPAFNFSTGNPDGRMATASRPGAGDNPEIESADDFILANQTSITQATITGLVPAGFTPEDIADVRVEIYRIFPADSNTRRTIQVPTRNNSPSDVDFVARDSSKSNLDYSFSILNANFTAQNSVLNGIHKSPNQTTGGEGAVSGKEIQLNISFAKPLNLAAGHYFFVPQIELKNGNFFWLSTASGQFTGDLQEWIRNSALAPDWLRVGTDIVGGATPPTFDAAFSLSGTTA